MKTNLFSYKHNKLGFFNRKISNLLFVILLISNVACEQGGTSDFTVLKSGYNAFSDGNSKTYWVDNDQVIFYGYEPKQDKKQIKKGIYIWNTKTGKVKFLAKSEGGLCFSDGYVHYYLGRQIIEQTDEGMTIKSGWANGLLGEQKEAWRTIFTPRGVNQDEDRLQSLFSEHECKIVERPEELTDHRWMPLKSEHGYLDKGLKNIKERRKQPPVLYFLRADGERFALPVNNESWLVKDYHPSKNAYLLLPNGIGDAQKNLESWKQTNCLEGYWLFPDGNIEQICHPYSEAWGEAILPYYPVKSGFIIATQNISGGKYFTNAAGYLLRNTSLIKLIDGQLSVLSISPDGCKIAFAHAKDWDDIRRGEQLKMINTCNGIGEQ